MQLSDVPCYNQFVNVCMTERGIAMGDNNKMKAIKKLCEEKQIRMIDFKMTDIDGRWRHITIPVERFGEETFTQGIGFDGSNYGYAPVEKSDMVFLPDPDTAYVDPFAEVPTLTMCGNVCTIGKGENTPFDQYPKNVSLRAVEYMKEAGIADRMVIGPEFEFYLLDNVRYEVSPKQCGYRADTRQADWMCLGIMDMKCHIRAAIMWRRLRMWDMICAAVCV